MQARTRINTFLHYIIWMYGDGELTALSVCQENIIEFYTSEYQHDDVDDDKRLNC